MYKPQVQENLHFNLPVVPQIQVTMDCDLNCVYCYEKHTNLRMDHATVEAILRRTAEHNRFAAPEAPVQVYWHGGEPLLAGAGFFKSVVALQSKMDGARFDNRLQTNGTLMTDELAGFFRDHHFSVGFSLDGPQDLHDRNRRFLHSRKGSFAATMKGLECYLKQNPASRPAVIAVVTKQSVDRVDDIYQFFNALGARVQLDIYDVRIEDVLKVGAHEDGGETLSPTSDAVGWFLMRLFDLWFNDPKPNADFAELRHEVKMALRPERKFGDPYHKKRCDFRRLIFSPNGDAFNCDQYINDAGTALGNIHNDSMADIVTNKMLLWEEIKRRLRKSGEAMGCGRCEWGRQCGGGCLTCMKYNVLLHQARASGLPDSKWFEGRLPARWNDIKGETYYCEGLRAFRRHVREAVQRELRDAEQ
jgi:uncharacterized protein